MAHQRTQSSNASGGPHAVSLKVLRLSRPSLATQTPLPRTAFGNGIDIPSTASLAHPPPDAKERSHEESSFPLTPLLTLPAAFGAAYVGEVFTCTLCANNEVQAGEKRSVSGVRVGAQLQSPSHQAGVALELEAAEGGADDVKEGTMEPGATVQRTLRHKLKEEGPHVLAVTVTYTETALDAEGGASGGRARTFRKLYQFVAQQLIAVRSKVTERKRREKEAARSWILEAQLENVGEASVVLEKAWLNERDGLGSVGMNGGQDGERTVLKPQDVQQVMFVLTEEKARDPEGADGRAPLAQLNIDWRSAMGEKGSLTTGWLASRGR